MGWPCIVEVKQSSPCATAGFFFTKFLVGELAFGARRGRSQMGGTHGGEELVSGAESDEGGLGKLVH